MTNTKKKLVFSFVSLLLCISMFVGSTYAWFTDTATTKVNSIVAGNLDIELLKLDGTNWVNAENQTLDFVDQDDNDLWEPGVTYKLPAIKIKNNGNLALKYVLLLDANKITQNIAEVIDVTAKITSTSGTVEQELGNLASLLADEDGVARGKLAGSEETASYELSFKMKELAGNEYQGGTISGINVTVLATQDTVEMDSIDETYDANAIAADYLVSNVDEFKAVLAKAEDGEYIGFTSGVYNFNNEKIEVNKSIGFMGSGELETEIQNAVFDIDSSSATHTMSTKFNNLKFTGTSRIVVGQRTHHNGVGGPNVLPITYVSVRNCYAKTEFTTDSLSGGKGQFIYLAPVYTVRLSLNLVGNTFINAHTISNEDAAPVVNGNGTVIENVYAVRNTFGSSEHPTSRYALKFGRRADGTNIVVSENKVYGATTSSKDFAILDLWQSGSNVQNNLNVTLNNNTIIGTPDAGRTMYDGYLEPTVKGNNLKVNSTGKVLDLAVRQ